MGDILGYLIYVKIHISDKIFNIPVSIELTTIAHVLMGIIWDMSQIQQATII